jgi:hypothetical protein
MNVLTDSLVGQALAAKEQQREGSNALWALTPEQRAAAMWAGELTRDQLYEWAKRAPDEVPKIGNEFAFIAIHTPEVAELDHERSR